VLEKHFTLNTEEKRIDSQAAVSLEKMKAIRELSDIMAIANGKGGLEMSAAEKKYGDVGPMKKAIVARRDIPEGKILKLDDFAYKRTEQSTYLDQDKLEILVGSKASMSIKKDSVITFSNVEYRFKIGAISQFFNNK